MIVVVGIPVAMTPGQAGLTGTPALAAIAAARAGATVELVGKVGDDAAGDAVVLALGRLGVGHAAVLRDPGHRTPIVTARPVDEGAALADDSESGSATAAEPVDRSDWPALEPEDVELALRYLPDIRAIIVAELMPEPVVKAVTTAASYAAARVVVVADPASSPDVDIVLAAPVSDADGAFAELLGQLSAVLDRGVGVEEAFREVNAQLGVTPVST
jgi:ribokinase